MADASRAAGGSTLRRAAGLAAALGLALGFLVLRSDHSRTTSEVATQEPATGALATAAARPPSGDDPSAGGTGVDLPGGVTVHRVATTDCVDRYGVALVGAATDASPTGGATEGSAATVVTAVLVRDGSAPLNALGVAVDDAVTAVTGSALTTLRTLTASVPPATSGPSGAAAAAGTCVTVSAPTLLAPSGRWGLLVTYLPAGATTLDDLRAAVLAQPFALLGDTTRAAVQRARSVAADVLDDLPAGGLVEDPTGQVADLLGPGGGSANAGTSTPSDLAGGLPGGLGGLTGTDPAPSSTLVPPLSLPDLPVPTVTLPSLPVPLPGLP